MPVSGARKAGKAYIEIYGDRSRLGGDLNASKRQIGAWASEVGQLARTAMAAAMAAAIPVALSARTFAGFQDQMLAVKAVTGAAADEFQRIYDLAKELGRTTSFTAAEVGGGMLSLGRAGFTPQEIQQTIAGVLSLSRATGTDLSMAAEIAAGTLRAFNLETSQTGRVMGVLVATANNSAQTLEELGESMKYVAPIAQEYGMTVEQTAKVLGVLANMQIKGSMAGTSVRQMLLRLTDPAVQDKLRSMGIDIAQYGTNFGDMMVALGRAMAGMPRLERLGLLRDLFDQRAAGSAAKLVAGGFDDLSAAIDNAGSVADDTAAMMDSGLGGAFRRMMSAVEGTQIALGETLGPTMAQWAASIASAAGALTAWIAKNKEAVAAAVDLVARFGALAATTYMLAQAVGVLKVAAMNPLVLGLVAAGAALYAYSRYAGDARDSTVEMADAMNKALAAGNQQRQIYSDHIDRLQELAAKQRLTNSELDEARQIVADLEQQFGSLGITVDDAGRSISGVGAAIRRMREDVLRSEYDAINDAIDERLDNIGRLNERIGNATGGDLFMGRVAGWEAERDREQAEIDRLATRRRAIHGELARSREAAAQAGEAVDTRPDLEDEDAMLAHQRRLYEIQMQGIEDATERAIALIHHKYDVEIEEAEKAGETIVGLEEERAAEIANIHAQAARDQAETERRFAERRAEREEQIAEDLERAKIDATLQGADRLKALAEMEAQRRRAEAEALGIDPASIDAELALRKMLIDQQQTPGAVSSAVGTFNAALIGRQGPDRMAKAVEDTARNTARTNEILEAAGLGIIAT